MLGQWICFREQSFFLSDLWDREVEGNSVAEGLLSMGLLFMRLSREAITWKFKQLRVNNTASARVS
jgi:hypothetical protein